MTPHTPPCTSSHLHLFHFVTLTISPLETPSLFLNWILISELVSVILEVSWLWPEIVLDIKHFLASNDLDIFGSCESNLSWHSLPNQIQLREWFPSADGCHSFHANNIHKNFRKFQYGSTFWIAAGRATSHISSSEQDPSTLGRWVACSLLGQSGKWLVIIFAYHPCTNMANHIHSVSAQHLWFFTSTHRYCNPWEAFLTDPPKCRIWQVCIVSYIKLCIDKYGKNSCQNLSRIYQ